MKTSGILTKRARLKASLYLSVASFASVAAHQASAQTVDPSDKPIENLDSNGIDLSEATITKTLGQIEIAKNTPSALNVTLQQSTPSLAVTSNLDATLTVGTDDLSNSSYIVISFQGGQDTFGDDGAGNYVSFRGNGATLTANGTGYTYISEKGVKVIFDTMQSGTDYNPWWGLVSKVAYPSGEELTYNYRIERSCPAGVTCSPNSTPTHYTRYARIQSISTNTGYQIRYSYLSNSIPLSYNKVAVDNWLKRDRVTAVNTNVDACNPTGDVCSYTASWPSLDIQTSDTGMVGGNRTVTTSVTDALGRVTSTTWKMQGGPGLGNLFTMKTPASPIDNVSAQATSTGITYVENGRTFSYNFLATLADSTKAVAVTGPNGSTTTYGILGVYSAGLLSMTPMVVNRILDANGNLTKYDYDFGARLTSITKPEGDSVSYDLDARGNITKATRIPKANSGLSSTFTTAVFPSSCVHIATCNLPSSTTDASGRTTDYTYDDATGQILTKTLPAAAVGGTRPQVRYSYTFYPTSSTPVSRLTGISTCDTSSSCSATSEETVVDTSYTSGNILPSTVTIRAGDGSLSAATSFTYDAIGHVTSIDGPLVGPGDTTAIRYNSIGEVVGIIRPDPDGNGPRLRSAIRITYDGAGRTSIVETGTISGIDDGAWSDFLSYSSSKNFYDANDLKTSTEELSGSIVKKVTQYSYDSYGRVDCRAVRMNPAQFDALPSSACTMSTPGVDGSDRVIKYSYDNENRITRVTTGLNTIDASDDAIVTYTPNGRVGSMVDANNNKTTYEYDGFDRLFRTYYPSVTKGALASSASDYEQLTYDANDNTASRRLRDGRSIVYTYDSLDRLASKTYPDGGARPVYYSYDLRGLMTAARYDSATGADAVTNNWDALGREMATTTAMSGVSRTVAFQYDAADNLTRITQPDGAFFQYNRDPLGRIDTILANGTANLIRYQYDDLGRRQSIDRYLSNGTWGASTTYSYDAAGRLASLSIGTITNPVSYGFSYNAAGQLTSQTVSNDAYAFNGFVDVDRNYTANGLNQYTTAGPASFAYDANGNLTSDGTTSFSYDIENRITSTSGGWTLTYDPLGRLYEQLQNGGGTQSLYDGDQIIAEYNPAGGAQYTRYLHGDGEDEPLLSLGGSGLSTVTYAYADRQGSIVALGDDSGSVTTLNSYDEFGIRTTAQGRFQYTGQNWLPLGLYYYKARMYSQTLGRFMQTDPIGYGDGLNWYNYVGGDPVNNTDPSGNEEIGNVPPGSDIIITGERGSGAGSLLDASSSTSSGPNSGEHQLGDIVITATRVDARLGAGSGPQNTPGIGHNGPPEEPSLGDIIIRAISIGRSRAALALTMLVTPTAASGPPPSKISPKPVMPSNPSMLGHIFRKAAGHFPKDTPRAREMIEDTAQRQHWIETDARGNDMYRQLNSDGTQTWVQSRDGVIFNAGLNQIPVYGSF